MAIRLAPIYPSRSRVGQHAGRGLARVAITRDYFGIAERHDGRQGRPLRRPWRPTAPTAFSGQTRPDPPGRTPAFHGSSHRMVRSIIAFVILIPWCDAPPRPACGIAILASDTGPAGPSCYAGAHCSIGTWPLPQPGPCPRPGMRSTPSPCAPYRPPSPTACLFRWHQWQAPRHGISAASVGPGVPNTIRGLFVDTGTFAPGRRMSSPSHERFHVPSVSVSAWAASSSRYPSTMDL